MHGKTVTVRAPGSGDLCVRLSGAEHGPAGIAWQASVQGLWWGKLGSCMCHHCILGGEHVCRCTLQFWARHCQSFAMSRAASAA